MAQQDKRIPAVIAYLRYLLLFIALSVLSACSSMDYYWQAISGHLELKSREQAVSELLADAQLDLTLRNRLLLAQQARQFASQQLGLPDNDSYTMYADLGRPFVVWNVIATPALSIEPKQWCYLFVGCLDYRGFFAKQEAQRYAQELVTEGLDVAVAGATAYSTLGYFDDPLLNTMLRRDEAELVGVIFHELAHQLVYVEGDTAFNEAFASTVEQEGLRRWYAARGDELVFQGYMRDREQRQAIFTMLRNTRSQLDTLYHSGIDNAGKVNAKAAIFGELKLEYREWRIQHEYAGFDNWFAQDLNNAHLALIATYQDLVPEFLTMLGAVDGNLQMFYKEVERFAQLPPAQRHLALRPPSDRN